MAIGAREDVWSQWRTCGGTEQKATKLNGVTRGKMGPHMVVEAYLYEKAGKLMDHVCDSRDYRDGGFDVQIGER